jgi:hypothetical protein
LDLSLLERYETAERSFSLAGRPDANPQYAGLKSVKTSNVLLVRVEYLGGTLPCDDSREVVTEKSLCSFYGLLKASKPYQSLL